MVLFLLFGPNDLQQHSGVCAIAEQTGATKTNGSLISNGQMRDTYLSNGRLFLDDEVELSKSKTTSATDITNDMTINVNISGLFEPFAAT